MKVYLPLISQEGGIVHFVKNEGSVLEAGDLVGTLELDNPAEIQKIVAYPGVLPEMKPPRKQENKTHQVVRSLLGVLRDVLQGYERSNFGQTGKDHALYPSEIEAVIDLVLSLVDELLHLLKDPKLPTLEFGDILSALASRLPKQLYDAISSVVTAYDQRFISILLLSLRFSLLTQQRCL